MASVIAIDGFMTGSGVTPSNGDRSHSLGINSRIIAGSLSGRDEKSPEIRGTAKIGTAFAMLSASMRGSARSQRERQKNAERNHQSLPPPRHLLRYLRGRGPGFRLQPAVSAPGVHRAALF